MNTQHPNFYNDEYPPIGQERTGVPTGFFQIDRAAGQGVILRKEAAREQAENGPAGLGLGEPMTTSELSGQPGYFIRTNWVELALTGEEMVRFICQDLRWHEYFDLRKKHGMFFEIYPFYEKETGWALSPHHSLAQELEWMKKRRLPHLLVLQEDGRPRVHSVVNPKQGAGLLRAYAKCGLHGWLLPLVAPADAPTLDPFENIVVLNIHSDGEVRAYGPFANSEDAEVHGRTQPHTHAIDTVQVAVANSSHTAGAD